MRLPNSARRCDRISTPLIRHSRTANTLYNGPQASPPIVTASGAGALDDSRQVVRDLHRFEPTGARNLARHLDERHRQEQLTMVAHQAAGLGGDLLELQNDVSLFLRTTLLGNGSRASRSGASVNALLFDEINR